MANMKLNFKSFNQKFLTEGSDFGIAHIEDLDIETFIRSIENIHKLEAIQKLDGANLRVGIDENGELFTSREQKGGKRFYNEHDFPKNSAYDAFKAAHLVLEKVEGSIQEVLDKGESINLEIIFGAQPNTVFYGKDNVNYIALLEMVQGDDPSVKPDQSKIQKLLKLLKGKVYNIRSTFADTIDGITIVKSPRVTDWKFTTSDKVPKNEVSEIDFSEKLSELKRFLRAENDAARDEGRDLTNFEVLKDHSKSLAEERKTLSEKIMTDFKLPIKQKLLDLVYKQKPSLRGDIDSSGAYSGIEGIIFTNPESRERFKVVDKDVFTSINNFNYQARKSIAGRIASADQDLPIESRGGIVGEAKLRSIKLFSLDNAELPMQTKKVIEKFKGDTKVETIHNLAKSLHQLKVPSIKRKMQAIYISALDELEGALDAFKQNASNYELELKNGKKIKYTKEIQRRTLMVFAEARKNITSMISKIRRANDMDDLIEIFFDAQLNQIHGE
jgi:hypothetical protein